MESHPSIKMVQQNVSQLWFKQFLKQTIRRKRRAYNKAHRTGTEKDWENFRDLRRSLDRELRKAGSNYLHQVGENLTTNNTKPFLSFIKSFKQSTTGVSALNTAGISYNHCGKSKCLEQ